MQDNPRGRFVVPLLIIGVGVGWLLSALGIGEGINWVWTIGLGVIGFLAFLVSGFDKFSIVVGPFFLFASVLSVLRQIGQLHADVEIPVLIISIGVLLLVAQLPLIPLPRWVAPLDSSSSSSSGASRDPAEK